jgi:hypothetical protein
MLSLLARAHSDSIKRRGRRRKQPVNQGGAGGLRAIDSEDVLHCGEVKRLVLSDKRKSKTAANGVQATVKE